MDYYTNSITLGGGESIDVILDASDIDRYPATASSTSTRRSSTTCRMTQKTSAA